MIFGGHAVIAHGYMRATEDVDILCLRSSEHDADLLRALQELNAFWISDEIDQDTGIEKTFPVNQEYVSGHHLMMLGTDQGFLDIFDYVHGCPETDVQQVFDDAVSIAGKRFVSLG